MSKKQPECDVEELYKWIDNYSISRQKRNISRDFSDALPLAEIIKHHYPKLVELHNYTARNSVSQKVINWQTLNRKVLNKLTIKLSNSMIEKLANGVPGCIEKVLFEVRDRLNEQAPETKSSDDMFFIEGLTESVSGSVIPIKSKDSSKAVDHKIVPVDTITQMENNLEEKNEAIAILRNKLQHLESLLAIKDERINDLTKQLQSSANQSNSPSKFSFKAPKLLNLF